MHLLRAATLAVKNVDVSSKLYAEWLGYELVEQGQLDGALAAACHAPDSAGKDYAVLAPVSGTDTYLRLVEATPVPGYAPLRTYGWNAIELAVQDVRATYETLKASPFEILYAPDAVGGLTTITAMQMKGLDKEIIYLTEINTPEDDTHLRKATCPIDAAFIMVMGCSNRAEMISFLAQNLGLDEGQSMSIVYKMINAAYSLPETDQHLLTTMSHEGDTFLEVDQYPEEATPRPRHGQELPPGIAMITFKTRDIDALKTTWLSRPVARKSVIYNGAKSGIIMAPDNTLIEIVEDK